MSYNCPTSGGANSTGEKKQESEKMSEWKKWLRQAVVRARESCCGDSPKDKRPLLKLIGRCTSICFDYNVPTQITKKLEQAYQIVNESKDYYGRLPADNILCDLLNNELGD